MRVAKVKLWHRDAGQAAWLALELVAVWIRRTGKSGGSVVLSSVTVTVGHFHIGC